LRQQLLVYRDLWSWINKPFEPPEVLTAADAAQMRLDL
jgi:hypothetical protein